MFVVPGQAGVLCKYKTLRKKILGFLSFLLYVGILSATICLPDGHLRSQTNSFIAGTHWQVFVSVFHEMV